MCIPVSPVIIRPIFYIVRAVACLVRLFTRSLVFCFLPQVISVFSEDEAAHGESSLVAVLARLSRLADSHADVAVASMAREIMDAVEAR